MLPITKSENTARGNVLTQAISNVQSHFFNKRVPPNFFNQSTYNLAKDLLGKILVHKLNDKLLKCRIVETEVYPGGTDKASHSCNGRKTLGNAPMYMKPGTTYVYFIYGMYYCFNISSSDDGGVVLIRAGEPIHGVEHMLSNRRTNSKSKSTTNYKFKQICNGPAKLCIAMNIEKNTSNAIDMSESDKFWIENDGYTCENKIIYSKRIGIDKTGKESVNKLYRFYILGNEHVSKRDKIKELNVFPIASQKVLTAESNSVNILKITVNMHLKRNFFNQSSYDLAKSLLGKVLVRNLDGVILKCRIVETELYPGGNDKGSVSYNDRRTPANEPVFMDAGTTYVYLTYGMYHCINISSGDFGGAVLLRAGEPLEGVDKMKELRTAKLKSKKILKSNEISNGPAKLCTSMNIEKITCNSLDITSSNILWIENDDNFQLNDSQIVHTKRIGIDRAGSEAVNQLFRFYILGNSNVSKLDKEKESEMQNI